jgi:hypothetical protein
VGEGDVRGWKGEDEVFKLNKDHFVTSSSPHKYNIQINFAPVIQVN